MTEKLDREFLDYSFYNQQWFKKWRNYWIHTLQRIDSIAGLGEIPCLMQYVIYLKPKPIQLSGIY